MILLTPLGEVDVYDWGTKYGVVVFSKVVGIFDIESEANAAAIAFARERAAEILADAQTTLKMLEEVK